MNVAREQQQQPKPKPGGEIDPPQRHQPWAHSKTGRRYLEDKQALRGAETQKVLFRVPTKPRAPPCTHEPRRHRPRREIDHTTTYFTDKPTDTHTDDRERPYLADERLQPLLELAGAAEVGACAGCDGFRDGSRPSRPPHGHVRCSRRGRTRLRGHERPPAQLQVGARICTLRVVASICC